VTVLIHADDIGLSESITSDIIGCIDYGTLNSTSIISNGYAFQATVNALKERKKIRVSVHLNLIECPPLSPPGQIPLLVDGNGNLNNSFGRLITKWISGNRAYRRELKAQVQKEFSHQIERTRDNLPHVADTLRIDGHQHIHMIPFVLDTLCQLKEELPISYIRIPREPFFWPPVDLLANPTSLGPNIIKHILLNQLARPAQKLFSGLNIDFTNLFYGVLMTGRMTEHAVIRVFENLRRSNFRDGVVEILFHPGRAAPHERDLWLHQEDLWEYYSSDWRSREAEILKSPRLKELIKSLTAK